MQHSPSGGFKHNRTPLFYMSRDGISVFGFLPLLQTPTPCPIKR
ncbi:hypothetical protein CEV32_2781 [Brucella rhizosphaerae]|uniref:Uncharacterized protein n=1 Tax=Brucella rhizosphaerae TaxID=571254 RepID=A0A256F022_9HYPH|nr:hypothetical protein CEV32_2781 [Brucella rhizosphaerae]